MPSTKDIDPFKKYFAIFKGSNGTGKTRAAGSFPAPYFLDTDGKLAILKTVFPDKDIQYDPFYENFAGSTRKLEALANYCPYGTVVLDSLTSYSRSTLTHMRISRGGKGDLKMGGVSINQMEDYNGETAALNQMVDALRVICEKGVYVILIAHVVEVTEKQLGKPSLVTRQLITGGKKVAAALPTFFDEAYHFYCDGGFDGKPAYRVNTTGIGEDWAKTALALPPTIKWNDKNFYDTLCELVPGLKRDKAKVEAAVGSKGGF